MFPCSFAESNGLLLPPDGKEDAVEPLSVCIATQEDGYHCVLSCWKMTPEELEAVNRTGRVWLMVLGSNHPPVQLCGEKPNLVPLGEQTDDRN